MFSPYWEAQTVSPICTSSQLKNELINKELYPVTSGWNTRQNYSTSKEVKGLLAILERIQEFPIFDS